MICGQILAINRETDVNNSFNLRLKEVRMPLRNGQAGTEPPELKGIPCPQIVEGDWSNRE